MAQPIKTLKEAIVSKISNGGSDVAVDDNLDLQSSNKIKNASAVSTERANNRVCVTQYPGNDLGEMINNARQDLETDTSNSYGDYIEDIYLYAEPGVYTLSTPANLTNMLGAVFDFRGSHITLSTNGQAAFDLAESWDYEFYATRLYGDPNNPPSSGLLVTNTDQQGAVNSEDSKTGGPERKWHHIQAMWGHYDYAPIFHQGRERTRILGNFANDASQGYVLIASSSNKVDISGTYKSETSPNNGSLPASISTKKLRVAQSSFFSIRNSGDGVVYIEGNAGGTTFTDNEITGKDERALVVIDSSESNITDLSFENNYYKVDNLTGTSGVAARPFLVQDNGNDNDVNRVSLDPTAVTPTDEGGTPLPFIEVTGNATIKNWTAPRKMGTNGVAPIETVNPIENVELPAGFNNPTFNRRCVTYGDVTNATINGALEAVRANVEDSTIDGRLFSDDSAVEHRRLSLNDDAGLRGSTDKSVAVLGGGSGHAIQAGETGKNVTVEQMLVAASGSSYDCINLAGSGTGTKNRISGVVVARSDRDGIALIDTAETLVEGCITKGYNTNVSGDDIVLDGPRNVVSSCYINGSVRLTGNAANCVMSGGIIRQDVVFESGSDNNDLTGVKILGSVTNNGGSGNDW